MKRGTSLTRTPSGPKSCCSIKRELRRLYGLVKQQGLTLIPLQAYFKGGLVKLEIGLCKGKKTYDKRAAAAQMDAKREIDRAIRARNR